MQSRRPSPIRREALIQEVRSWLDTSQVVVLVGPPGIGKSTVAEALGPDVWLSAAEAVGLPAVEQLDALSPRQGYELRCSLAVALASARPELAQQVLPEGDDGLAQRARSVLDGLAVPEGGTASERILVGIAAQARPRALVARDGAAFQRAGGERVDIARWKVLRRVLAVLATADGPLDVDGLCERVWPGESLVGQSGTRRVHVAISTLRGLRLRDAILTDTTGESTCWRLDADVVDEM